MRIGVTKIYVNDQDDALRFYTDVAGLVKKADVTQGPFRWLTVASAEEPDGVELQLAPNDDPAAKAYQQATFEQGQPAFMFYVDDVQREYDRMTAAGAAFTMPPTKVTGSTIAILNDQDQAENLLLNRSAEASPAPNRTSVLARPTGFNRADAIDIRIPIAGAGEAWWAGESA